MGRVLPAGRPKGALANTSEYLGLFLDELRENLQALSAAFLELERDPSDGESLASIFRVAHFLKGMSATMGSTAWRS